MIERIVDSINTNNFGVLFHSTKAIEEFQKRSGMEGAYTTEYQHHYIALVARLQAEDQVLDMAIPMCMYNYHQEVGGASVEFNLGEVGEADNEAMRKAIEKFNEFETTDMYKSLVDMGFMSFTLQGMNSIHAHPSGVNRFSGTDLRADIKHPGVNFPLSTGDDIPNFASIIQHKEGFAEIIHSEYRMFNGVADGERKYEKGRTLTVVKGYNVPEPEPWVEPEPGIIDQLFGTKRTPPPRPAPRKKRNSYWLEDGFANADKEKLQSLKDELMQIWRECEFEIDVSLVLKTNVLKGRGRLLTATKTRTWGGHVSSGKSKIEEYNEGLFGEWRGRSDRDETLDDEEPPFWEMKRYLVNQGQFTSMEMNAMSVDELKDAYWLERLDEMEDDEAGIIKEDEKDSLLFTEDEYINMLAADNIMSREKLLMLNSIDLKALIVEVYGNF